MPIFEEGQSVRDTYVIERFLGEGAFGEVYRARHRFLGRQAMKVFKTVGMTLAEIEKALGEALILARLGHPNITRVFEANTVDTPRGPCGFFTMEYIAGGSLEQYRHGLGTQRIPVAAVVDIIRQICSGLAVAHLSSPPIIHRDIKPGNILVTLTDQGLKAQLSDFGLAKHVNRLTLLASSRGTIGFRAPEAFKVLGGDSCASDVWAVGCTFYYLLTDQMPYPQPDGDDLLRPPRYQPLIPPSRLNIHVDRVLDEVVERSLALNPRDRHTNGRQLLDDLSHWQPSAATPRPAALASAAPVPTAAAPEVSAETQARKMVREAVQLALRSGRLTDAAELLEQACVLCPALREEYAEQIQLWRRGIAM